MEENGENKIKKVINYSAMSTREMNSSNGTKGTNKNEKINKNNHNDNNNSSPTNNNNNNRDKQQLEEIRHQLGLMTVLLCKICARFNISASTLSSLNENDKGATTDKNELIFSTTINESDDVLQQVSGLVSALDSLISENRAFVKRFESSERSARELTSAGIKNDISAGQKATGNLSPATSALLRGGVFSVKPPSVAFERVLSFTDGDDRIFTSTPKTQRDEPINEVAESTPSEIAERRSDNCRRSAPRTINLTKDRRSGLLLPMGMSTRGPLQFPDVRDEANNSTTKTHLSEKCSQRQITASEKEKENRADGKPSWRETNRSHKHSSTPRITKKLFSRLNSKPLEGSDESEGDNQEARRISWMEEREATPSDPMTDNSSELIDAVVRSRNAFTPLPRPALTCHLCSEVLADNNARHLHNVRFHRSQLIESILCRDRSECDDESRPLNTDNNFIRSANSFENCQSESSIHVSIENNDDKNSDLSVNSERFSLSESEPRATPTPQPTRGEFDVSRFDISSRIERFNNNNSDNDRSACKTPSDFGQQQNSCKNRRRTGYDEKTTPSVREMVKSFHEKATTSPPTSSRKPAHQITGEVYGTPLPPSRKTVAVKRRDRRRGSASGSSSSSTTFNLNPFWNYVGCGRRISSCSFSSDEFARSYPGTNVVDSTPVSGTISGLQFLNSFANAALVLRGRQRQRIV